MRRRLSLLTAFLLILVFGVTSTAVAQPFPEAEGTSFATSRSGLHSPQNVDRSSVVIPDERKTRALSSQAVRQALLQNVESDPVLPTSVDLSTSSGMNLPVQSNSGNGGRRVVYIVGGVLVVGGAIAGILALSSRGNGNGGAGIPPPGNRP